MPLINGQKMACEPCIRGHRSTKCTHANERVMVSVRKPGRPLSACPHSGTQSCACAKLTAAIPRKQKCHCGTTSSPAPQAAGVQEVKMEKDDEVTELRSPGRSSSNSISGPSSHRVQKSVNKTNGSRNPTIDTTKLERMDPSQFNILPSPDGLQQTTHTVSASPMSQNMFAYGPMGMTPGTQSYPSQPLMFPMFPQPMASPVMEHPVNGHIHKQSLATNGNMADTPAASGNCCGGSSAQTASQPSTTPTSPGTDSSTAPKKSGSCCSSKPAAATPVTTQPGSTNGNGAHAYNAPMMLPGFFAPMPAAPNGMYPVYPQHQSDVYTYPPQFGSYMHPLQFEQYRQFIASGFNMTPAMPVPAPGSTIMGGGTTHQCGCGDGCQCVGCAAHPFNDATQDYIQSAWDNMADPPRAKTTTNGHHQQLTNGHIISSHTVPNGTSEIALMQDAINGVPPTASREGEAGETALLQDGLNGVPPVVATNGETSEAALMQDAINGIATASKGPQGNGTTSPNAPQTPSEAASGISEEQTLSANDFFFVNYTLRDSCLGDTSSCPCGDDCQCIGCAIHGNAPAAPETT
ncbi:hypothetical protein CC79DRAFT_817620 [Sarocladium strictum]